MTAMAKELALQVAALGLPDPEICVPNLCSLMERVGCTASPAEFLGFVSRSYQYALKTLTIPDAPFESQPSHVVFREGLARASRFLPDNARILVVGCGEDLAGRKADYAVQAVHDVISPGKVSILHSWNWTRADVTSTTRFENVSHFDLVVTNSLLHFAAELGAALQRISGLLSTSGMYLMAHEPNARFWSNLFLRQERQQMRVGTATNWRHRVFSWSAYSRKLRTLFGQKQPTSRESVVNRYLAEKYSLRGFLTAQEIAALVDPHRPSELGDGFRVGLNGLSVEFLSNVWGGHMHTIWTQSYDHLGPSDYSELPLKWQERDRELAAQYPSDGSSWTALWKVKQAR